MLQNEATFKNSRALSLGKIPENFQWGEGCEKKLYQIFINMGDLI